MTKSQLVGLKIKEDFFGDLYVEIPTEDGKITIVYLKELFKD